jgi:hypothetical protein
MTRIAHLVVVQKYFSKMGSFSCFIFVLSYALGTGGSGIDGSIVEIVL